MEIDEKRLISSLCPAVKRFYQNHYDILKLPPSEIMKHWISKLRVYEQTKDPFVFQTLVSLWLLHGNPQVIKGVYNDLIMEYLFNEENGDKRISVYKLDEIVKNSQTEIFRNGQNTLIIITDESFFLIDYIYIDLKNKRGF